MSLLQTQQRFLDYLLQPLATTPTAAMDGFASEVIESNALPVTRRLHIYHHAYRARLVEVMQDVFERTWAYLGDEGFADAADGYVEQYRSTERTLNRYGEQFPVYLARRFPSDIDVSEVAMIDWMVRCAFDGADATPISPTALAALPAEDWATVGFAFHPTTTTAPLSHNAASIWEALEAELPPPSAAPLPAPTRLVVWRREFRPHFRTIEPAEAEAIALLQSGVSFAVTCARLADAQPEADIAALAGVWLRRWLGEEMLVAVR